MFGYIKTYPSEMLVKEYELYKAIYCGLCRTGGKNVSRFTRLFLSYDFTALAALRMALIESDAKTVSKRCPYAFKKKSAIECDEVFTYTTAAAACLNYLKVLDDLEDEKGFVRFGKIMLKPLFVRMKNRAVKLYPSLCEKISAPIEESTRLETDGKRHTLDEYAHGSAAAVALIASFGLEGTDKAIAYEAGYHIGRYIYIIDAVDDLEKDVIKHNFNPLISHFGSKEAAVINMPTIDETLIASGVRFSAAVGFAKASVYTDILQNIAGLGMEDTVKAVYEKYAYKRKENKQI